MKSLAAIIIASLAVPISGHAQDLGAAHPGVMLGGEVPCGTPQEHCLEVHKDPLDRLNKELKKEVEQTNPALPSAPLDATSSDLKLGVVNIPAVKQQYGKNFGVSVYPYRPAAPASSNPVHGTH